MYPAIFQGGPILSQSQDEEAHVILFTASQTEAKATLAALKLHHKTTLFIVIILKEFI